MGCLRPIKFSNCAKPLNPTILILKDNFDAICIPLKLHHHYHRRGLPARRPLSAYCRWAGGGTGSSDYHLSPNERLNEAIHRSWNRLLQAEPDANVSPQQASSFIGRVTNSMAQLQTALDQMAYDRAETLLDAHRRVRTAARVTVVSYDVKPHLPVDILGIYTILPTAS